MIGLLKSPDEETVDLVKTWLGLLAREADYLKGMVKQMAHISKSAKKEIEEKEFSERYPKESLTDFLSRNSW